MRSPTLLSILTAFLVGACSQSLGSNIAGTGGALTPSGGAGGGGLSGTGGLGGGTAPACNNLAAEYQSALTAAQTCQVGAPGQCQQIVGGSVYACSGTTYVTDSSALDAISRDWLAYGCQTVVPPCAPPAPPLNTTCVSVDGGSVGFCSYVPGTGTGAAGASGGTGGSGGAGGAPVDGGPVSAPEAVFYPSTESPGSYVLALSNVPIDCENTIPTVPCSPQGVMYLVSLLLTAGDISPGIYLLNDLPSAGFSEVAPSMDGTSSCSFGGGSLEGSLEIVSVSTADVVFQLLASAATGFEAPRSTITAQRCAGGVDSGS